MSIDVNRGGRFTNKHFIMTGCTPLPWYSIAVADLRGKIGTLALSSG